MKDRTEPSPLRRAVGARAAAAAVGLLCLAAASLHGAGDGYFPDDGRVEVVDLASTDFDHASIADSLALESGVLDTGRSLSVALPDGECAITKARPSPIPISQTWQASFPGSGSRMTWSLVEALTGIRTNNDYDSAKRGYENVVAVKTHYPVKNARNGFEALDALFDRAMVIFRNPIDAIPSYFNLQYEHEHNLPNHSTRGSQEEWIEYRDSSYRGVLYQLEGYERFVSYWMERYPDRRDRLLITAYEDLTDTERGPGEAARIAEFLGRSEGVYPIDEASVRCVWETMVNYKGSGSAEPTLQDVVVEPAEPAPAPEAVESKVQRNLRRRRNKRLRELMTTKERDREGGRRRSLFAIGGKVQGPPPTSVRIHGNSLRAGPKVRPYTTEQLEAMASMLWRLVDRYGGEDEEFRRIFLSYIEKVEGTEPNQGLDD